MPDYGSPYEHGRETLIKGLVPHGTGVAVDIGCNDGRFTSLLPAAGYDVVIGYDTDEAVLRRAAATHPAIDFRMGVDDFSLTGRSLTLMLEVLEHIAPAQQLHFLRGLRAATAEGGLLLLSTPSRYSLLATFERLRGFRQHRLVPYCWWDGTHVSVLTYRRLHRLLCAAGFSVEQEVGFCFAPPRLVQPGAAGGRLARFGFDLVLVARAVP